MGDKTCYFTPADKFLELIFHNKFVSSILAKCVCDESCGGNFLSTSPKGLVFVAPKIFLYIVEDLQ